MAQRYDIVRIDFQANARGANAAIESLRVEADKCNDKLTELKKTLKEQKAANATQKEIDNTKALIAQQEKLFKVYDKGYKELVKGMRTLDQGIKAFNDGTLNQMSAAFQKALYNAAKLTRTKLAPDSETYKKDYRELTAVMDASQQNFARLQGDAAAMLKTLKDGGKVSASALREEVNAQKELLSVLAETDKGYKTTQKNIAVMESYLRVMGGDYEYVRQNIRDTQKVSDEMLRNMYNELQKTNQEGKVTKDIMLENAKAMREIRAEQARRVESTLGGDLTKQNEGAIRQAIASAKELLSTYKTGSKQAQALSAQIVNAEEHLKTHGVEGERAARKQAEAAQLLADKYKMMEDRVKNLGKLSDGALAETQKFWQEQMNGAERGSKAYREAEKNMKAVAAEQERLAKAQLQRQANRIAPDKLGRSRLGSLSEQELQASIAAAKQLAASMKPTDQAYKDLVNNIIRAEEHVKQFGLEGQRSARQAADQMQMMVDRMSKLKALSGGALEETKKFWEAQMAGAERGSKAYLDAENHIKNIVAEQERLAAEQAKTTAQGIYGNKMTMSEASIRKAIEAAKQYQQTLSATDTEYKRLSAAIVDAEEHIKKYGIESERAARKELEAAKKTAEQRKQTDDLMKQQLQQGTALSRSALKAQEQYWQRLIDDPKTAAASLAEYEAKLGEVQGIIRTQKREQGRQVLSEFRRDPNLGDTLSADKLKEYTDKLKAYRDTLPKSANAATIKDIDDILQKVGASAKKAAEQTMPLGDAYRIAMQGLQGSFKGTNEQLKQAKKTLEEQFAAAEKGTRRYNLLQRALNGIALEEKRVADMSKEIQAVLDQPKGRSFNELKQAVEQGRAALQNMRRTTTQEKKDFDEFAAKIKAADQEMKNLGASAKGTASAFDKAWSRLKTYIGLYVGAAVAMQKLTSTMGDLMELSDKMGEVRKTTGFTADEVGRLATNLRNLDVRSSLTSLMEVSAKAGQLGLKTEEDVLGFTEAANKLMIALPEMGAEAATEMMKVALATGEITKIQKQMQEGLVDGDNAVAIALTKVGSTIDQLRANSAAAAPQITDFVKRVGAVGAQSGISIDQVAALGSTVDALGLRVEMSATALSRMIPAIRNNAFAVAKAIKVEPEALRSLFDAGRGMEAILMIFQHIKDSGMDADSIESMLGMGGMQEVMKELNQQGARAGIVFAGLSQNVDELRRQLGVAANAYEENMAIQREFEKMNETTAARWERLKNQLEEAFVGDTSQRWLGNIIDGLRWIVDLLTERVSPALKVVSGLVKTLIFYWSLIKLGLGEGIFVKAVEGLKNMASGLTNLISNTQAYIKYSILLKRAHTEQAKAAIEARMAQEGLNKAMIANIWTALIAAIGYLVYKMYDLATATNELDETFRKLQADEEAAERDVNRLDAAFKKTSATVADATKKHDELKKQTEDLRKEVDEMKKSTDKNTEASDALKKKEEELKKSEEDLKKATDDMNKAKKDHSGVIAEINSKYSSYLGYMLSEVTNADLVASAHQRIVTALRAELEQKRLLENQKAIEEKYGEGIKEWTQDSRDELKSLPRDVQDQIMRRRSNMMAQVSYEMQETKDANGQVKVVGRFVVPAIDGLGNRPMQFATESEARNYLKKLTAAIVQQETLDKGIGLGMKMRTKTVQGDYLGTTKRVTEKTGKPVTAEEFVNRIWGGAYGSASLNDGFQRLTSAELRRMEERSRQRYQDQGSVEGANTQLNKKTLDDIQKNAGEISKTLKENKELSDKQISEMGRQLNAVVQSSAKYGGSSADVQIYFGENEDMTLDNAAKKMLGSLDEKTRKKVLNAARRNARAGTGGTTSPTYESSNVWGERQPADSTTYKDMDADALVNRRKQMNEFVKSIQTDTDVKRVLKEDAALMKAFQGRQATMREVVEWYNTERLKIQDELHARHLTNTGDWMDPKKERGAKKQFRDEMDAYLHELDAYYTERKTRIEEAGTDEGLTEAEIQNRTLNNEMEWQQRRAELQKLYSRKQKEVTQEELDAIYHIIAERTGDSETFVKAQIAKTNQFVDSIEKSGEKGAAIVHRWMSQVELDTERSYLKGQQALTKQMRAIEAIIDKERPFNGITKSLQESLSTMDILTGEMRKEYNELMKQGKDTADFNARQHQEEMKRTAFLLGEAENAYSTTIDRVMDDMRQKGMTAWADWLSADPKLQEALMAQLRSTYDAIQDAIKKEASQLKKQAEIMWNNKLMPDGKTTLKQQTDRIVAQLGLDEGRVKRANSLIGAGQASERVADKLAIQQMKIQLAMQEHYYNLMRKQGQAHVDMLNAQAKAAKERGDEEEATRKTLDAQHAQMSLNLATSKEETELAKQREDIIARTEESQNRLYTELKSWADLLASSLQGVMEASHTADRDYYNERAKLNLTGKGGPGAGTYIVIENEGTSDAKAHYEYLDERAALERQRKIENDNAVKDAWKKIADDINNKMAEQITDWMNSVFMQANTDATIANTNAIIGLTETMRGADGEPSGTGAAAGAQTETPGAAYLMGGNGKTVNGGNMGVDENGVPNALKMPEQTEGSLTSFWATSEGQKELMAGWNEEVWQRYGDAGVAAQQRIAEAQTETPGAGTPTFAMSEEQAAAGIEQTDNIYQRMTEASEWATSQILGNQQKVKQGEKDTENQMVKGSQSAFAKMAAAANMYGIAYQAMSNDNLSTTQKVLMMSVQAAGQAAISMLTVDLSKSAADTSAKMPNIYAQCIEWAGPYAGPVLFAVLSGVLGGLMGLAVSKIAKGKSEIAQATGSSVGAGRLSTGMLTYGEGNVNEFTDPKSLTPGRSYNVDSADGKTYRAKYMGKDAKTHITNGPEFHLVGEKGREAIIDAHTTRLMQMDDRGIWQSIQTLYNGGRISARRRTVGNGGVRAFAGGNLDEFEEVLDGAGGENGVVADLEGMRAALDRNSAVQEALLERLNQPIYALNKLYGPEGLPNVIAQLQKEAQRHGVKYL